MGRDDYAEHVEHDLGGHVRVMFVINDYVFIAMQHGSNCGLTAGMV